MLNEKSCNVFITEPNGMRLTVAQAINCGDFQASYACKGCNTGGCDDDGDGY